MASLDDIYLPKMVDIVLGCASIKLSTVGDDQ